MIQTVSIVAVSRRTENDVGFKSSVFGLLLAALGTWFLRGYISPIYKSAHSIATVCLFAVPLAAGLLTGIIVLINDTDRLRARWFAIRVGACSFWYIPASLLSLCGSWAAIAGGVTGAVATAVCLRPCIASESSLTPSTPQAEVIAIATSLHGALLSALIGEEVLAVTLAGLGSFIFVWYTLANLGGVVFAPKISRAPNWLAISSTAVCLVITPVLIGLANRRGGLSVDRSSQEQFKSDPRYRHSGVILQTDKRVYTLLAPVPHQRSTILHNAAKPMPFTIPFSGAYWFYAPGFAYWHDRLIQRWRPPDDARLETGDPLIWNLSLPNAKVPLIMKAYQPLQQTLEVSCCSAIEVVVENAHVPAPTALAELVLIDTELRPGLGQSLGTLVVPKDLLTPTLRFLISNRGRMRQFDALELVFSGPSVHESHSLGIAVREFELIPR